jgi:hypothetical protein
MSLIADPEGDRLCGVETEEERRRFEDERRIFVGSEGILMYGLEGDLLTVCEGVDERLSGIRGRELGGL